MIADAYANGWCVEHDPVQECYWTAVVRQLNPDSAKHAIKRLFKSMNRIDVERARSLINSDPGLLSNGNSV